MPPPGQDMLIRTQLRCMGWRMATCKPLQQPRLWKATKSGATNNETARLAKANFMQRNSRAAKMSMVYPDNAPFNARNKRWDPNETCKTKPYRTMDVTIPGEPLKSGEIITRNPSGTAPPPPPHAAHRLRLGKGI